MVINFEFRHGAKRSFGLPVAKLWPNIFQYISIYFTKSWFPLVSYQLDPKKRYFHNVMHCDIPGLLGKLVVTQEPPQFFSSSENVIFGT